VACGCCVSEGGSHEAVSTGCGKNSRAASNRGRGRNEKREKTRLPNRSRGEVQALVNQSVLLFILNLNFNPYPTMIFLKI